MVKVVSLSPEAMHMSIFGDNSQQVQSYLSSQMDQIGHLAGGVGSKIYNALEASYNFVSDSLNLFNIRQELFQNDLSELDNNFQEVNTFRDLQMLNVTMQRYMMALPELKQLYINDDIFGYSGTYIPITPDGVGEEDYDFRRVMNGIGRRNENDEYEFVEYWDSLIDGDRELELDEQDNILHGWDVAHTYLNGSKYDFTRPSEDPDDLVKMNK